MKKKENKKMENNLKTSIRKRNVHEAVEPAKDSPMGYFSQRRRAEGSPKENMLLTGV